MTGRRMRARYYITAGAQAVLLAAAAGAAVFNLSYGEMERAAMIRCEVSGDIAAEYVEAESGPVNINTATARELKKIKGIGEEKAAAIVEYRERNGRFGSVWELAKVTGIGEKTVERIMGEITV